MRVGFETVRQREKDRDSSACSSNEVFDQPNRHMRSTTKCLVLNVDADAQHHDQIAKPCY